MLKPPPPALPPRPTATPKRVSDRVDLTETHWRNRRGDVVAVVTDDWRTRKDDVDSGLLRVIYQADGRLAWESVHMLVTEGLSLDHSTIRKEFQGE